jgi:hypothetical protein
MKKIALLTGTIALFVILFYTISGIFLSYNKSVDSPYVLLEGWISLYHMEFAANYIIANNYDSVFVIGFKNQDNTVSIQQAKKTKKLKGYDNNYVFFANGILGFEVPTEKLKDNSTLNITMRGTSALKHFPHYQVFANEHLIGSGFVSEKDSSYKFNLLNNIADSLTYVSINFDNHLMPSLGNRHLFISDIKIDMVNIDSISIGNFFIDNSPNTNFEFISGLNRIKYYLADRGYDVSKVKLIWLEPKSFNKSIAIAKCAKDYFRQSKITSINIITIEHHSKRSYINFGNSVDNVEFGCITIHNSALYENSLYYKIDARISLLLTKIYWWFH